LRRPGSTGKSLYGRRFLKTGRLFPSALQLAGHGIVSGNLPSTRFIESKTIPGCIH